MTTPRERLKGFLAHLDSVFGVEPSFHPLDSTVAALPQVVLKRNTFQKIDVGADLPVNLQGVFPIYDEERELIAEIGLEKFWHSQNFDMYDVNRQRVVPSKP